MIPENEQITVYVMLVKYMCCLIPANKEQQQQQLWPAWRAPGAQRWGRSVSCPWRPWSCPVRWPLTPGTGRPSGTHWAWCGSPTQWWQTPGGRCTRGSHTPQNLGSWSTTGPGPWASERPGWWRSPPPPAEAAGTAAATGPSTAGRAASARSRRGRWSTRPAGGRRSAGWRSRRGRTGDFCEDRSQGNLGAAFQVALLSHFATPFLK